MHIWRPSTPESSCEIELALSRDRPQKWRNRSDAVLNLVRLPGRLVHRRLRLRRRSDAILCAQTTRADEEKKGRVSAALFLCGAAGDRNRYSTRHFGF